MKLTPKILQNARRVCQAFVTTEDDAGEAARVDAFNMVISPELVLALVDAVEKSETVRKPKRK